MWDGRERETTRKAGHEPGSDCHLSPPSSKEFPGIQDSRPGPLGRSELIYIMIGGWNILNSSLA